MYPWFASAFRPGQGPRWSPASKSGAMNECSPATVASSDGFLGDCGGGLNLQLEPSMVQKAVSSRKLVEQHAVTHSIDEW